MGVIGMLLDGRGLSAPLTAVEGEAAAAAFGPAAGLAVYPRSVAAKDGLVYALGRSGRSRRLCLVCDAARRRQTPFIRLEGEERSVTLEGRRLALLVTPADHAAAQVLRHEWPFLVPRVAGVRPSVGLGDRLGLGTPGHIRAARGRGIFPFLAQQSIREMTRTGRTPEEVMDDALWGVVQEGYREGFGADADHLKTEEDVANCAEAGFTMFTVDPGDHVNDAADALPLDLLEAEFEALPWKDLDERPHHCLKRHSGLKVDLGSAGSFTFGKVALLRAAVKYGAAVAHTARLYRRLAALMAGKDFEVEMSVDETDSPTTVAEHFYVATELKRLGVRWVSLAPRFVGAFEKGVDYRGNLAEFETSFAEHAAVARRLGPYKLSIHSGSDKFSIYPVAARLAGKLVHVKTAGTSYVEALRVVAEKDPALFREILDFARGRYETDRATYHVSGDVGRVPAPGDLADDQLAAVLDGDDGRQVLHVTYGSVLQAVTAEGRPRFKERLSACLWDHEERYAEVLERHLGRHVAPFASGNHV